MIGSQLDHFRITAKLGEGGMGEVYRAEDAKLGREVAIKVLPDAFATDPERLARFEREAKVLASLNHPNIAGIFEVGESDVAPSPIGGGPPRAVPGEQTPGTGPGAAASGRIHFLVMELAPGDTLASRIDKGPLSVGEALPIAVQVCRALEAAHERGIIHRDLKPANVVVDERRQVKVLDFGLAKALEPDPESETAAELAHSPTLTYQATIAGTLMGTAAYMSPEQARGEPADRRSDIWSFGVVLWEMLTGRRLFDGGTVSDTLAGILRDDIRVSELPSTCPASLRRLLRRCLERDPDRRLHDIADARIIIQDLVEGVGEIEGDTTATPAPPRRSGNPLPWIAALLMAGVGAGFLGYLAGSPTESALEPLRLTVRLAPHQELSTGGNSILAFAPDGESLVMVGRENGQQVLFQRFLHDQVARPIEGTEGGEAPFFSPDGQWIGFVAGGRLRKVAVEGGRPFDLAESRGAGGSAWLADDTLVFAPIYSDGLFRVSPAGGPVERLTAPDRESGELGHWWPAEFPSGDDDSRCVVFTAFRTPVDQSRIGVLDLESKTIDWIVEGGFFGRYVETGHLLYARGQRLFAVPFDPASRRVTGPAVAVLDDLRVSQTGGFGMVAVSKDGVLAYVTESLGNPPSETVWVERDGQARLAVDERHRYLSASLSPDGHRTAVTIQQESRDLWTYSFDRGTLSRLTSGPDTEFDPVWSRDGRELFYVVDTPPFELHRIPIASPDGGTPIWPERPELDTTEIAVSPDGRFLAFTLTEEQTGTNVYTRALDGSEPPRPFRSTRAEERYPAFSPDGQWIVYESGETGRPEIYVEAFPGPGERFQISADGGTEPKWATSSGEIFFRHGDEMRLVATRLDNGFEFDDSRTLFSLPMLRSRDSESRGWDVTADGQRFLAVRIPNASVPRQVEIVTDWSSELARRAPSER